MKMLVAFFVLSMAAAALDRWYDGGHAAIVTMLFFFVALLMVRLLDLEDKVRRMSAGDGYVRNSPR